MLRMEFLCESVTIYKETCLALAGFCFYIEIVSVNKKMVGLIRLLIYV